MSIISLIKEKPKKKLERLFQILGFFSILILAGSIFGVGFIMFYHWYTPWQTDYIVSWPEIIGMAGLMWWQFISSIYIYIAFLLRTISFNYGLEFSLPSSIIANLIFFVLLFFSIKSSVTKKVQELTNLTRKIAKIFIILFVLNLIISIIGIIEIFYIHFLK